MPRSPDTSHGQPALKAVERGENLSLQVYRELRQALIAGAFPPGTPMSTRTTASAVGVSITPAREALGRLVSEGALEITPSRLIRVPRLSAARIAEIYQIRKSLEPMVVEMAAPRLRPRVVATLGRLCDAHEAALDARDYRASLAANQRFLFAIYECADMPVALRIIEGLWLQCGPVLHLLYPAFEIDRTGVRNHRAMIEAAAAGDAAGLRASRLDELCAAEEVLMSAMGAQEAEQKALHAA